MQRQLQFPFDRSHFSHYLLYSGSSLKGVYGPVLYFLTVCFSNND